MSGPNQVWLSIYETDPIGPFIILYEMADVNGLVSIYTHLPPIQSGKNKGKGDLSTSFWLDQIGGQSGVNGQPVHLHPSAYRA